ncbi:MAG: sigma-70 family RNA polymerase sigma factor [Alphaproteobacteria bacterium]|nr:sigma-70 family RNA polymerase sigma factor [Alphaproteobacteria bacterium]
MVGGTESGERGPTGRDGHVTLILRVARQQDRGAFAILFGHYGPRVKSYLIRLGASRATAEDLLQDVMLAVWRRADTYDPVQASVSTWIFTIARNKRIDTLRRERRPELDPTDPALAPKPEPEPDRAVDAAQWETHIAGAIAEMPREQAEMIRLAYFDDLSHSDIAVRLGLPLGTVKSRIRLALARLRTKFADRAEP